MRQVRARLAQAGPCKDVGRQDGQQDWEQAWGPMAEHANAEVVRRGYSAFANADMDGIQSLFADDVVWHIGGRSPLTGDYGGKEAVLGFPGDLASQT